MGNTITSKYLLSLDKQYYLQVYARYPLALEKGEGVYVWDFEGKKYIDALAGIAVNSLGHAHPVLVEAIQKQAAQLIHVSNFYVSKPQVLLAKKMVELSGMDRAFFTNSGAEAVEGAIKLARKYGHAKNKGGTIISMDGCFHGRTMATIAAGKEEMQKGFEPIPDGFKKVPFNNIKALKENVGKDTCAVIIEVLQGEGGIVQADHDYIQTVRELCDKNDILLIFDEVQCGAARTGKFFGYEHFDVTPDMVTMAKGLAGGVPIGAVLVKQKVADVITFGEHGTTFGGNSLATAAALATVGVLEDPAFLDEVSQKGMFFKSLIKEKAEGLKAIKEIRGIGLMLGVVLDEDLVARDVVEKMLSLGVLANATSGNTIRLVPPLVITKEQIEQVVNVLFLSIDNIKK
jgi:acetylornithine/N-succinyldiaminopimelate aminotransferase